MKKKNDNMSKPIGIEKLKKAKIVFEVTKSAIELAYSLQKISRPLSDEQNKILKEIKRVHKLVNGFNEATPEASFIRVWSNHNKKMEALINTFAKGGITLPSSSRSPAQPKREQVRKRADSSTLRGK